MLISRSQINKLHPFSFRRTIHFAHENFHTWKVIPFSGIPMHQINQQPNPFTESRLCSLVAVNYKPI